MKILLASIKNNSYYLLKNKAIDILSKRQNIPEEQRIYINDKKGIRVGKNPQVFYYYYNNRLYYFTAKNALFSINSKGFITWYYGEWIDGFFRNGLWVDGIWRDGTWCRGNWIDGKWYGGKWYKGKIDGKNSNTPPLLNN